MDQNSIHEINVTFLVKQGVANALFSCVGMPVNDITFELIVQNILDNLNGLKLRSIIVASKMPKIKVMINDGNVATVQFYDPDSGTELNYSDLVKFLGMPQ